MPPLNGSINNLTEGASIIFRCDEGFSPSSGMTAVCTRDMTWNPDPRNHQCYLTAEDNSPPDLVLTFGLGTLIATSVSSFIFGVLLATSVLLGVLLGIFIHKRAMEGKRANDSHQVGLTKSTLLLLLLLLLLLSLVWSHLRRLLIRCMK